MMDRVLVEIRILYLKVLNTVKIVIFYTEILTRKDSCFAVFLHECATGEKKSTIPVFESKSQFLKRNIFLMR